MHSPPNSWSECSTRGASPGSPLSPFIPSPRPKSTFGSLGYLSNCLKIVCDRLWMAICVAHMEWAILVARKWFIGDFMRRITFLSGSSDTNANLCTFLRVLYTLLPPKLGYDVAEAKWGSLFLEKQFSILISIVRLVGFRVLPPPLRPIFISYYSRAIEAKRYIRKSILEDGVTQIVILGAGFDTTGYRTRDDELLSQKKVRIFEVDLESVQKNKLQIMRNALTSKEFDYYTESVVYTPCNFGVDRLDQSLLSVGLNPNEKTAILWEGVTYYLELAALEKTLLELQNLFQGKSHPTLFFDYMHKESLSSKHSWLWNLEQRQAKAMGTPFITGFSDVSTVLKRFGFQVQRTIDLATLTSRLRDEGTLKVFFEANSTENHSEPRLGMIECFLR